MATYTLTGLGTRALTAGTSRLNLTTTLTSERFKFGDATPTNYYHLGLLRFGVGGFFGPTTPLDGLTIYRDLPANTNALGYNLSPGVSLSVTEQFPSAVGVGNPLRVAHNFYAPVAVGAAAVTVWTYTVPANRLYRIGAGSVSLPAGLPVTSVVMLALNGTPIVVQTSTTALPSGSSQVTQLATTPLLGPGEVLSALVWNGSNAAQYMGAVATGWEFDQATWIPAA